MEDPSSSEDSFESCREYVEDSNPHADPYALEERGDEFHNAETAGDAATAAVSSACRARAGWPERIECICESLKRILHDGCRAKHETEESGRDPFQTPTEHFGLIRTALDALQDQHRTSSPYECPRHGVMPHQVTQSTCTFCAGVVVSCAADPAGCGDVAGGGLHGGVGGVPYVEFGSPADVGLGSVPGPYVGFGSAADVGLGGVPDPHVRFGRAADVGLGGVPDPHVRFGSAADVGLGGVPFVSFGSVADVGLGGVPDPHVRFGSAADVGLGGGPYVSFGSVADVDFGSVPYVGFGGAAGVGLGDSVDAGLGGGADVRLDGGGNVGLVESGEAGFGVDADVCLGDNRDVGLGGGAYVGFDDGGDVGVEGSADVGFGHSGGVGADVGFGERRDVGVGRDTGVGGCADVEFGERHDVEFGERHDVGVGGCVNVGFGGAGDVGVDSSTDVGFGDCDDVGVGGDAGVGGCADVGFGEMGDVGVDSSADVGSGVCDNVGVGGDVGVAGGGSGEGPCTAGGLSAEEKARRKVLNKASKKLLKVQRDLVTVVEDTERQRKGQQAQMDLMDSNVEEIEKSLQDHVSQLHHLLDHHHQRQQELLRQRHKDFLHQILVTVMEGQNFEARLLDLQERVGERLNRIFKHRDVVAADADDVRALCEAFRLLTESKPTLQAQTVTYTVEVPQVTADDLQSLMGRFVITEERQPPHPEPAPDTVPVWSDSGTTPVHPEPAPDTAHVWSDNGRNPVHPALEPAMPTSGAGTAKRSGPDTQASVPSGRSASENPTQTRKASKGEAPEGAGIPKWTAPKWPLGSPSLGAKEKLSETGSKKQKKKAGASTAPAHPAPSPAETAGGGAAAPKGPGTCTWATVAARGLSAPTNANANARTVSSANSTGGVAPEWLAPKWPPNTSGSLGAKEKLSETMASTSSIASSTCSSSASRKRRSRSRKKKNKAAAAAPPTPGAIILPSEAAAPKRIAGRGKQASGFAPRPDGEVWVVYGNRDPHLDLLNEKGDVLESTRIGGNAMGAASFSEEHVLVSFHSPRCQLMLLDSRKEARETFKLPLISTGLGVGSTGIAVSGYTSLYWIPLDGGRNEWIVEEKGSTLKHVCSCDVVILYGREIVCAADKGGHEVCFYEKLESGGFSPLPPFSPGVASEKGEAAGAGSFTPLCVSAHQAGFLAVLDACSRSVVVLDVERNEAVSVLPWERLCKGEPAVIAFTFAANDEAPKMWVSTTSGELYLASLAFCYGDL